jgi:tetratricopeptide (TPR) repeat protein
MKCVDSKVIPLAGVVAVLCGMLFSTADGQSRRRRDRDFDPIPPKSRVNPVHERLKQQAKDAYAQGKHQRVIDLMNTVLRENPRDHFAYYYRGSARADLGAAGRDAKLTRQGIADARQAIALDGAKTAYYYLPYLYGMSNLTVIEGRKDHAETSVKVADQVLRTAGLSSTDKANFYYQQGYAYKAMGKLDDAAKAFQSAIRNSRVHLASHLEAANVYALAGKTAEAKAQYDRAALTFSDNPLVFNLRGVFLQSQGKYAEAKDDFDTVIRLDRDSATGYLNRGFCWLGLGDAKAAERDFTESLRHNNRQPLAYVMRARARMAQSDTAGATADNRAALRLNPKDADSHAQLGFCLLFSGNPAEAIKSFDQAVKLNAGLRYLSPWQFLALERAGRKDEAFKRFEKELGKSADDRNWGDSLLAFLAGKIDAKALLAAVKQSDAGRKAAQTCEAHYFIGAKHHSAAETEPAQRHFKSALATNQRQLSAYRGAELALRKLPSPKTGM